MNGTKRMSVFTALVLGISAVAITCIVSGSVIIVYGMRIVDKKADTVVGAVRGLVEDLPALKAALPPALADAINDERRPDYAGCLKIKVDLQSDPAHDRAATMSASVTNDGDQVVSLLALRLVALDPDGRPIYATNEYVATPLAIDNDWRGPLMPGATRRFTKTHGCSRKAATVEYEITELRVWRPNTSVGTDAGAPSLARTEPSLQ